MLRLPAPTTPSAAATPTAATASHVVASVDSACLTPVVMRRLHRGNHTPTCAATHSHAACCAPEPAAAPPRHLACSRTVRCVLRPGGGTPTGVAPSPCCVDGIDTAMGVARRTPVPATTASARRIAITHSGTAGLACGRWLAQCGAHYAHRRLPLAPDHASVALRHRTWRHAHVSAGLWRGRPPPPTVTRPVATTKARWRSACRWHCPRHERRRWQRAAPAAELAAPLAALAAARRCDRSRCRAPSPPPAAPSWCARECCDAGTSVRSAPPPAIATAKLAAPTSPLGGSSRARSRPTSSRRMPHVGTGHIAAAAS